MKPNRDASELAARLAGAAATPVPLPIPSPPANVPAPVRETPAVPHKAAPEAARKGRPAVQTVGITLRPPKTLLQRYTLAAAERTRKTGRVISAQEMMLERLEDGP
jgi:hypothetical protein